MIVPHMSGCEPDHLAFWVTDVDRIYKKLLTKGAKKVVKPFSQDRYRLAFVEDLSCMFLNDSLVTSLTCFLVFSGE